MNSRTSHYYELVVWIKPDGGETVAFMMASIRIRHKWRDSDIAALGALAQALAAQLNVPLGPHGDSPVIFK